MVAYHINSDESDKYTYDKSNDNSMFRCSDHDPIIVGLRLDSTATAIPEVIVPEMTIYYSDQCPYIRHAEGGYYAIYQLDGRMISSNTITSNDMAILGLKQGLYIINVYGQGRCLQTKLIVR
jgi:hypothetical protein